MRKNRLLINCLFFIFCLSISIKGFSQPDSMMDIYSSRYQQERVYIHFDKGAYNAGETIWFKAYILAGTDLSDFSKNFYVDWIDADGKLLLHTITPVIESSARGQFDIPANYSGTGIVVRAYTRWMTNFDSAFNYEKNIPIFKLGATAKKEGQTPVTTINFFPEGGELVDGISATMAFAATNQFKKPVKVIGVIKDSKGVVVDSFKSIHDGMGKLYMMPDASETYTAYYKDENGVNGTAVLPIPKTTGVAMSVISVKDKTMVTVSRSENVTENLKAINVVASLHQHLVYRAKVNLSSKTQVTAAIPTAELPTGILQITLFDANWQPLTERVTFVNNEEYKFNPQIKLLNTATTKRAKNSIEINVPDSLKSNLSIAITDAGIATDSTDNIVSHFLLSSDMRGYINNPAYYFANNADSTVKHLDLVMLTHGWRRYKWLDVLQNKMPVVVNKRDSDYMQIKGNVFGATFNKSSKVEYITLILQAKDSSKQILFLPINPDGSFIQKGVIFFDTVKVYYAFNGNKALNDRTEVTFQNGLIPVPKNITGDFATYKWNIDTSIFAKNRAVAEEEERVRKLLASTTLKEVVVTTRAKQTKDVLDEKYTSGLFSGGDAKNFDITNDPSAMGMQDVFAYLTGRVGGLQIGRGDDGEATVTRRGSATGLYLDEMPVDAATLQTISMADVAYVKVFDPPFFGSFGGGAGGAVAVYTRKGGDVKYTPGNGLARKTIPGYTPIKEFYSPDYAADLGSTIDVRTTLYWNPFILTSPNNNKVKVDFFNNDITKKFRIVLEGINAEGKLARIVKIIE